MSNTEHTRKPYGVGKFLRDVGIVAVGVVVVLTGGSLSLVFGGAAIGTKIVDRGVAVTRSCEYGGPFESGTPGWWWTCQADITWQDGSRERATIEHSQLTGEDIGHEVPVVKRDISGAHGTSIYRASFDPKPVLSFVVSLPLMLGGGVPIMVVLYRWWQMLKSAWNGTKPNRYAR